MFGDATCSSCDGAGSKKAKAEREIGQQRQFTDQHEREARLKEQQDLEDFERRERKLADMELRNADEKAKLEEQREQLDLRAAAQDQAQKSQVEQEARVRREV